MGKYCILPFVSLRIEDTENTNSMGIRPCCNYRSDSSLVFDSIDQYLGSDFLKELQQHLLTQDNLPHGCRQCQETENKKLLSVRQSKNKFFKESEPSARGIRTQS